MSSQSKVPAGPTGDTTMPETDLQKGERIVVGMPKKKWMRVRNELMELWDRLGTPIVNKKRCATLELKRLEAEAVAIKPFFSMAQFPEYAEGKRKLNTDDSPGARQPDDNCREGVASVPSVAKPSTLKDGHCPQSATLITGLAIVTDKKWQSASPAYLVGPTMPVHPKPIPTEKSRRIALAAEKMKLHAAAAACLQEMLETSRFMNPMDRLLYIRDNVATSLSRPQTAVQCCRSWSRARGQWSTPPSTMVATNLLRIRTRSDGKINQGSSTATASKKAVVAYSPGDRRQSSRSCRQSRPPATSDSSRSPWTRQPHQRKRYKLR